MVFFSLLTFRFSLIFVSLHSVMRKLLLLSAASLTLSASAAQPNDSLDARYYRLFAPVTFYHNVADKALALNSDAAGKDAVVDEVDAALLNVYLNRPDLVSATETELKLQSSMSLKTRLTLWLCRNRSSGLIKAMVSCSSCRTMCQATGIREVSRTTRW